LRYFPSGHVVGRALEEVTGGTALEEVTGGTALEEAFGRALEEEEEESAKLLEEELEESMGKAEDVTGGVDEDSLSLEDSFEKPDE